MLQGLLCSVIFLIGISGSLLAQNDVVPHNVFQEQGGIEIILDDSNDITTYDDHEGITIDHGCSHHTPRLYVTESGYNHLIENNVAFTYMPRPEVILNMKGPSEIGKLYRSECLPDIDFYPTYEGYLEMMNSFQEQYPDLCRVFSIGTLDSGRDIMMIQLGDDLDSSQDEPNFLYTSTMHGDETTGFPMMLQLIDYLLCNYETDSRILTLMNEVNIFINPLANPDGTYTNDNSTVQGATRRNANFIDLNRNFPDPEDGQNPDNRPTQDETLAFIEFADTYNIQMSANFHGGAEVISYPWDTWSRRHADDSWWIEVSREYADACQENGPNGYMRDLQDGITHGWDWFEVDGGRQDLMIYFLRGREFTVELSQIKLESATRLPMFWNANRESLIAYLEQATYGLRGQITDCVTGEPVNAEVVMIGHDVDNSSVFSDSATGYFYRFLDGAVYNAMIVADGYDTLFMDIDIQDKETSVINVELCQQATTTANLDLEEVNVVITGDVLSISGSLANEIDAIDIYTADGRLLQSENSPRTRLDIDYLESGIYIVRVTADSRENSIRVYKN